MSRSEADPVLLRVYQNLLEAIAEEMGSALERTGFSPNIKERRDYSCALFDAGGAMVAQAAHIPVHLGSTALAVRAALRAHRFRRGDVILLNDPYSGGTHLPDLTMVAAVFAGAEETPCFYVANRAHHADVGGMAPGSMALFTEIYQEGLRVPPVLLVREGMVVADIEALLVANMRQPAERRGDLRAQRNALAVGVLGLTRLLARCARSELLAYLEHLQSAAERHVRALLETIPRGVYRAEEWIEDDGAGGIEIPLRVAITVAGDRCTFDFAGTVSAVAGCLNAPPGITISAIFYLLRTLAGADVPSNDGCLRPVEVRIPRGSLLDPEPPAAVAGGNVETSQRLVDLLFEALRPALPERIPAQSQGTMNNVTLGAPRGPRGGFAYYETIGGGAGAGAWGNGADAVHTHMTNTRNTPIEALEHALPVRVREYAIRRGSGGRGRHQGGEGIVREFEALAPMQVALLGERRKRRPAGAAGGGAGAAGSNLLVPLSGAGEELPSKWQGTLAIGERLRIETPGGGGWGE